MEDHSRLKEMIAQSNAGLAALTERLKGRERIIELVKALSGTANSVITSSFQAKQTFIQGAGQQNDVDASVHDGNKQKFADIIKELEENQKQLMQLINDITASVNQAMRAAGGVA
ncbi:YopD protein [compost metagenome]